ncbi:hypothetical protein Acr_00g0050730 [Actinidia rufa]|uniref:Tetratricopeptide repeat (TPR)-like superfamily protein n=1 Tax=Actinidia rufa TaxID=165716 RepID=A0A7J0DMH7_9ERIC|nr:hypothetical protein Acr_00g0050730 [Actinidia rufa]
MSTKTVVSLNSLIAVFVRNGDVESTWELFNQMLKTDLVSWNTMIGGLMQGSLFEEAIELFRVMCGDTETAMLAFSRMKERDVSAWTTAIGAMAFRRKWNLSKRAFQRDVKARDET